jgi:hypothetical protein
VRDGVDGEGRRTWRMRGVGEVQLAWSCTCAGLLFQSNTHNLRLVSVASQKHAAMKLNIANPSTGQMKVHPVPMLQCI